MTHEEALDVLETISELYPHFELTKKKAQLLLPQLKKMDYKRVIDKLAAYVSTNPFPPTIADIAAYPPSNNDHLEKMKEWQREASKVPIETKRRFQEHIRQLMKEKSHDDS